MGGIRFFFFFVIGALSLSRGRLHRRLNDQPKKETHLRNSRWRPSHSDGLTAADGRLGASGAVTNAHKQFHRHFMAYGTGKKPKILDIKTKYSTTTELQWRPLSPGRGCWQQLLSLKLSLCLPHLFWSLSPCILYTSLYLMHSYSPPPPSLPSVLLNLNQMLHHWRDRKEANVGKEARHYIFLFICQWSFSSFSLSLNRTACDILFKMIYIYIFLNGMKTN